MFSSSLRAARLPLFAVGATLGVLLAGCGGGGTNLPTPGSGNGNLGDRGNNGGGAANNGPTLGTNTIVFVSTRDGNPEIYSINTDGTTPRRLTNNAATDEQPSRSRDGRNIAFSSQRDGNAEIYKMNADGSGLQRLTTDTGPATEAPADTNPVFSPDGTQIVWQSTRGNVRRLWTMDASGANQRALVFADTLQTALDGSWNPDSRRVLGLTPNAGNSNLSDLILISRGATSSDADTFQTLSSGLSATHPRFSPDGARIVYSNSATIGGTGSGTSSGGAGGATTGAAMLQFLDGSGNPVAGAPTGGQNQLSPSFSPDGTRLVWDANASTNASSPQRQLYIATIGTGTTPATGTQITTTGQGENYDASWTQ